MSVQEELRGLYQSNAGGRGWNLLFDMLANYTNRRRVLHAEVAESATGLTKETVRKNLQELADLGLGKFKFGRHKLKTRIEWRYSPRSVGQVAQGVTDQLEDYQTDEPEDGEQPGGSQSDVQTEEGTTRLPSSPGTYAGIIETAKRSLASQLGISPDQIEITIKL